MKLLVSSTLENIATLMSKGSKRYCLDVKLECYSCKMVSDEKRKYKKFISERSLNEVTTSESVNSAADELSPNSKSRFQDPKSVKLALHPSQTIVYYDQSRKDANDDLFRSTISPRELFCLIETMNICFEPEYDFSFARSDEFCIEPQFADVEKYISDMCSIYLDKYSHLSSSLWSAIDEQILLKESIIYSYRPDNRTDPYSEGVLDSFNYFFFNKSKNNERILFFSLRVLQQNLSTRGHAESDEMSEIY